jgi:hypothetical protein
LDLRVVPHPDAEQESWTHSDEYRETDPIGGFTSRRDARINFCTTVRF